MTNVGDFAVDSTVRIPWSTNNGSGASIAVTTPGTVKIYKDSSNTERTSLNGVTSTLNFDGITGRHLLSIDLSDNTDAGFYAAGHDYHVGYDAAVIDTQIVNVWLGTFSIENRGHGTPDSIAAAIANLDLTTIASAPDLSPANAWRAGTGTWQITASGPTGFQLKIYKDKALTQLVLTANLTAAAGNPFTKSEVQ